MMVCVALQAAVWKTCAKRQSEYRENQCRNVIEWSFACSSAAVLIRKNRPLMRTCEVA
jgi:hypothetical protein